MLLEHESNDDNQNNNCLDYYPLVDESDVTNDHSDNIDVTDKEVNIGKKIRNNEDALSNDGTQYDVAESSVDFNHDEMTLPSNAPSIVCELNDVESVVSNRF